MMIDHSALAESRIATQYQASENFRAYIRALMAQSQELEGVFQSIAESRDIDLAEGVQLDIIGEIVGVSRIVRSAINLRFFGFNGQPNAVTFGEENMPGGGLLDGTYPLDGSWYLSPWVVWPVDWGGRLRDEEESYIGTTVLSDPEYRLLIRAKIVKNHSKGTNEDIIAGLSYIFDDAPSIVYDVGGMAIGVAIGKALTVTEIALLTNEDIIARPAGVKLTFIAVYPAGSQFGFDGQTGALGFGEEMSIGGGVLAEEYTPVY